MTFKIDLEQAQTPLVLALDVGSTGTRGGLYDATGLPVSGHHHKEVHQFSTDSDGTSTIDPDRVVAEIRAVLDTVLGALDPGAVAAVAIDTFSSSLVGVDATGQPLTPLFTYADSRCAAEVGHLRADLDEAEAQQRTGTRFHTSYLPARLLWLRRTEPDLLRSVRHWLSLSEYVHLKLLGHTAAGTSVAAWTGLLDRRRGVWDEPLLDHVGLAVDRLSPIHDPDQVLIPQTDEVAQRWPALRDAVWLPGIADGFASNLGAGGSDATTMVLAMATSGAARVLVDQIPDTIPSGLWCYRVDSRRSLFGGALNDVGRAVSWLNSTLQLPSAEALHEVLLADPQPTTALVLPFFTGERSTGWAGGARAVFTGVSEAHTPADLYRATLEGVALAYARLAAQLREVAGAPQRILVSGRIPTLVPAVTQLLADALVAPVQPLAIKRSTLLGTALLALEQVAADVPRAEVALGGVNEPVADRTAYYAGRLGEFERVYGSVVS